MDQDIIEVPLTLLDSPPSQVEGERAFVLSQPDIGRIEIGSPFPDDKVWQHFSGDLVSEVVLQTNGGKTVGGGGTWDDQKIGYLLSLPGSGDDKTEPGWAVIRPIPEGWDRVMVRFGEQRLAQAPIRGVAAVPLQPGNGYTVEVFGVDSAGTETLLTDFNFELSPPPGSLPDETAK